MRSRRMVRARSLIKQLLVRWDLLRHGLDPSVRRWRPVLQAPSGHVVIPSRALATSRAEAAGFAHWAMFKPGDHVLDVGAGNGRQAIGLLEAGISSYTGLEVIRASVDYANQAFANLGDVHFDFFDVANGMYNPDGVMQSAEATFPYENETFDFVIAGSLYTHLEHVTVARRYVAETARVLRSHGTAYMSWFREPPNQVTDSAVRTVFDEQEIYMILDEYFEIIHTEGGDTVDYHDQWRMFLRKRS